MRFQSFIRDDRLTYSENAQKLDQKLNVSRKIKMLKMLINKTKNVLNSKCSWGHVKIHVSEGESQQVTGRFVNEMSPLKSLKQSISVMFL